ncbi:glycosyl transferase [Sediminibacterium roseum]|uniref:Glycosyl transferase n=1 Tax=Sediminibacterium roseum TaxID=1978412 RepID=A0ABW9ZUX2_9BACT|nr:glycosyltransferase family protein [Sediminibacterium roseum]NCI50029.1 glycosyl transferase [Sediminibacterium roseum]
MKILYSIQATGNGHIARAAELMPFLSRYGKVDVFLSGSNSSLDTSLPVRYKSKGLSLFYGNSGGLDYWKMIKAFSPVRILREARDLPVERYDVVLNDFESITSLACKLKNVPFIHFGHQASFQSQHTPRPKKKDPAGEFILKHYASSRHNIGLHFKKYDDFIFSPVIKEKILQADVTDEGHITVYLSHYADAVVEKYLSQVKDVLFHVFSKTKKEVERKNNILFMPVNNERFTQSMISSYGVITGAGFETPAETLYLGKKLICVPIQGQYEQLCNAAAISDFNVPVVGHIDEGFPAKISQWLSGAWPETLQLQHSTACIVEAVMEKAAMMRAQKQLIHSPGYNFSM